MPARPFPRPWNSFSRRVLDHTIACIRLDFEGMLRIMLDRPLFEPWNRESKNSGKSKNIHQLVSLCDIMLIYA